MNKDDGKRLIQDTLQNTFSKDRFIYFVKNLLNDYDESKAFQSHGYVLEIYRDFVKSYERLGTFTDTVGKKIDILIVYLQHENSIDKARTAQRNFIAQYLKDRGEKDAGLIAFVSPNLEDWRFSFVKMEYRFEETKDGKVKAKENFTPAKRYSFLVGPHEASHTAQSRMLPILLNDTINPTLDEIEDIFSVEKVTKEFFEQYKKLFLNLADEFLTNKEFQEKVVKVHGIQVADFVKKLMGQIVFLYFLQKKGWLGVKTGERWGAGDKRFMHNLFDRQYCEYENYFNDVLEPLFYDTLNKRDRGNSMVTNDQSYSPHFKCRIPYLNGGLFTPVYDWQKTKIYIDNKYFHDIFEVFDTFNFTVFESDPIEKEIAVDPEMLGKVFENLLEVRDRKSKGAFYTPREIVHYMCQESLINYLISQSGFPEIRIRNLMRSKDKGIARDKKQIEAIESNSGLKEIAIKVNSLLKSVRVCDPAVGSGAFPMGLLKEISTTRFFLNKHFIKDKNKFGNPLTEYDIKKETLENCIYGVDIDPGAVEIARLRFWLSLVVEHDIEEIEPLPNLDYKIMQGNSLIELLSPNLLAKTNDDERNKIIDQLSTAKIEYFSLSDSLLKSRKREEINLLVRHIVNYDKEKQRGNIWEKIKDIRSQMGLFTDKKITEQLNIGDVTSKEISKEFEQLNKIENVSNSEHFEWHLNFNEIFEKGGFDIVIANPPYIKEYTNKKAFERLKKSPYYQGKMDIWYLFACKGIDLLKNNSGVLTFIAQNNWVTSYGASKMRDKVLSDTQILSLIDFGDYKIFEAGIQTMVMMFRKNIDEKHYLFDYRRISGRDLRINDIDAILNKIKKINIEYLTPIIIRDKLIGKMLTFGDNQTELILQKMSNKANFILDAKGEVAQGIVPNPDVIGNGNIKKISLAKIKKHSIKIGDGVFIVSKNFFQTLNEYEKSLIKPIYEPTDLLKYTLKNSNEKVIIYLTKNADESKIPNLKNYLEKYKEIMDERRENINGRLKYFHLHWPREERFFKAGPKILSIRKCLFPTFSYTEDETYVMMSINIIKTDRLNLKYLTGLLNSKLMKFWLSHKGKMQGNNYQIDKEPIIGLPILNLLGVEQNLIVQLVDKIIEIIKSQGFSISTNMKLQVKEYEKQIDQMVYRLYGLTPEEIQVVENQHFK